MKWPLKRIGDVCDVVPGFAFKSITLGETGIPVIKIGNITDSRSVDIESAQCLPENLVDDKHRKYCLWNGDILIAMTGATAGKVGRIRCAEDRELLPSRCYSIVDATECVPPSSVFSNHFAS